MIMARDSQNLAQTSPSRPSHSPFSPHTSASMTSYQVQTSEYRNSETPNVATLNSTILRNIDHTEPQAHQATGLSALYPLARVLDGLPRRRAAFDDEEMILRRAVAESARAITTESARLNESQRTVSDLRARVKSFARQRDAADRKLSQLRKDYNAQQSRLQDSSSQIALLHKELWECQGMLKKSREGAAADQLRIKDSRNTSSTLCQQLQECQQRLEESLRGQEANQSTLQEMKRDSAFLEKQLSECRQLLQQSEKNNDDLQERLRASNNEVKQLQKDNSDYVSQIQKRGKEIENHEELTLSCQAQLKDYKYKLDLSEKDAQDCRTQLHACDAKLKKSDQDRSEQQSQLTEIQNKMGGLRVSLEEMSIRCRDLRDINLELENCNTRLSHEDKKLVRDNDELRDDLLNSRRAQLQANKDIGLVVHAMCTHLARPYTTSNLKEMLLEARLDSGVVAELLSREASFKDFVSTSPFERGGRRSSGWAAKRLRSGSEEPLLEAPRPKMSRVEDGDGSETSSLSSASASDAETEESDTIIVNANPT